MDNFPAAVAGPDALNPRPTRAFREYSQARGLILDPARVRSPRDKPHVENGIRYARERFWKGATFIDVADSRTRAEVWCRDGAGLRVHGTTRKLPRVVFEDEERAQLQPYDGVPYDVPLWREVTVHVDHHVSVQYALYSAPSVTCPPGTKLEARCDRALVKLYRRGDLVKVHPRQPKGGRSTDADDYPAERTAYAMRAPDRIVRQAVKLGPTIGQFAERLLEGHFPWSKLRQGQKLLRLAERYTAERLDAACARALGFDLVDVRRVERILVLALEHEGQCFRPSLRGHSGDRAMSVDADLVRLLKRLKLGQLLPTLPERLTLARAQQLDYAQFLTLLLADEVQRREQQALERHLLQAGFEERITLDDFDWSAPIQLDRRQLQHVFTLQFLERKEHVLIVGPVGVGKTFVVQALGAATVRAGKSVLFVRADELLRELGQARADYTFEKVFRRYLTPDLLILDDFGLRRLNAQQSTDLYELIIARHRHSSFAITSNRGVDEWLTLFDDPLLGNSALDRLANAAHQLVIEGPSYRAKLSPKHRPTEDQP